MNSSVDESSAETPDVDEPLAEVVCAPPRESLDGTEGRDGRPDNRLLQLLSDEEYARLEPHLRHETLRQEQVLREARQPAERVYFPTSGVISLILPSYEGPREGEHIEVGLVGREGMACGAAASGFAPAFRWTVLVSGEAYSLPISILWEEVRRGGNLQPALDEHQQLLLAQAAQCALCNRMHTVGERLSRWLLLMRDRGGSDQFEIRQEIIAYQLGTGRPAVTVALGVLRQAGLIGSMRGRIWITDPARLEQTACECFGALREAFTSLSEPNN